MHSQTVQTPSQDTEKPSRASEARTEICMWTGASKTERAKGRALRDCSQIRDDDGTRDTPGWVVAEPLQAALDGPEVLTKL